jgi:tRNA 2-thiocytidine biosynthesis protein TtcA
MTRLLADLDARFPGTRQNMLAAMGNVRPSHLFDKGLWKRLGLEVAREAEPGAEVDGDPGAVLPAARLLRGMA